MPITIKYASKASKLAPYIEGKVVEIRDPRELEKAISKLRSAWRRWGERFDT